MGTNARLYDTDFYAWVQDQVALLAAHRFEELDLQTNGASGHFDIPQRCLRRRSIRWIDEHGYAGCVRHQLMQHFEPFPPKFLGEHTHAGDVAAGPIQACNETKANRIGGGREDDWNRRGRRLGGKCGRGSPRREQDGHSRTNEIGGQRRQSVVSAVRPAKCDDEVSSLDIAGFAQPFPERRDYIT